MCNANDKIMLDNKIGNISIRCIVIFYICKFYNNQPVSSVAERTLSERKVWGLTPRPVKSAVSRAARHRCNVSSELCCLGAKLRR